MDDAGRDGTKKRLAENEALFREMNESTHYVRKLADPEEDTSLSIVCECGRPKCTQFIEVSRAEYEHIRSQSTWFFTLPGHESPLVERVINRSARYLVVEKLPGIPAEVANEEDPR